MGNKYIHIYRESVFLIVNKGEGSAWGAASVRRTPFNFSTLLANKASLTSLFHSSHSLEIRPRTGHAPLRDLRFAPNAPVREALTLRVSTDGILARSGPGRRQTPRSFVAGTLTAQIHPGRFVHFTRFSIQLYAVVITLFSK